MKIIYLTNSINILVIKINTQMVSNFTSWKTENISIDIAPKFAVAAITPAHSLSNT